MQRLYVRRADMLKKKYEEFSHVLLYADAGLLEITDQELQLLCLKLRVCEKLLADALETLHQSQMFCLYEYLEAPSLPPEMMETTLELQRRTPPEDLPVEPKPDLDFIHGEEPVHLTSSASPALRGYCLWTLVEKGLMMKGNAKWGVVRFEGQDYLFHNPRGRNEFMRAPNRYLLRLEDVCTGRWERLSILGIEAK